MLVKDWESRQVVTIEENDSMLDATSILKEQDIRMLPVLSNGKLVGIVTDRDLKSASASDASTLEIHELLYLLSKIKIKDIMTPDPITVHEDFTIEETAELLLANKISGCPVVDDDGNIVAIITQTDLFRAIISLTGLQQGGGIQFSFQLEDRPGSIKDVADIIRKYGGRMASILTTYEGVPAGYRKAYIRMYDVDRDKRDQLKEELKGAATVLYMIDHQENIREIY